MADFHGPEQTEALYKRLEKDGRLEIGELSAAEGHAVKEQMQALDRLFGGRQVQARYKIEVHFGKERSTWKPCPGAVALFLSGSKLHGGGDDKLYFCPKSDCNGIIWPNERMGSSVVCRTCQMVWSENDIVGEMLYRLTPRDWATVIHRIFARCEHNADIYVKYHWSDIRRQTEMEMAAKKGGEEVRKARKARGLHIYPLKNIIKDTSNGAQLYDRILAFITA